MTFFKNISFSKTDKEDGSSFTFWLSFIWIILHCTDFYCSCFSLLLRWKERVFSLAEVALFCEIMKIIVQNDQTYTCAGNESLR